MKKLICLFAVLVLCLSASIPAFAEEAVPTGDSARGSLGLLICLMVISAAGIVVLICIKRKK